MRTTVIPAQITTVEDKIAGNFNFTQILLMVAALMIATLIYAVLPSSMKFTIYKIPLTTISVLVCLILAIRVKGKVVLSWLLILSSYYLRPRLYVLNKNDVYLRDIIEEVILIKKKKAVAKQNIKNEAKLKTLTDKDLSLLQRLLHDPKANLTFRFNKGGGMNAIWQAKS